MSTATPSPQEKSPPLLELRGLRVAFPIRGGLLRRTRAWLNAVDGVSLRVEAGETLGLVGESGCGKSTLARAILRLERPIDGTILYQGRDLLAASAAPLRREVQMVFQDPFSSLNPRMTVRELVTEAAVAHGLLPRAKRSARAGELLADVGLAPELRARYPHAFSGGQRQRVSIARALSLDPRLLVCDEPVSALDVSVQAQVINLLMDLQREHQLAMLFISHDLSVVQHLAHRVAVMYLGRIVEHGPTEAVMQRPAHPYTRLLLAAVPRVGAPPTTIPEARLDPPGTLPPESCTFAPRCPLAGAECLEGRPQEQPVDDAGTHWAACIRCRRPTPPQP